MIFSHTTLRCQSLAWLAAMSWYPGVEAAAKPLLTGFELAMPGALRELNSPIGTWRAAAGHAEVTGKYHYTGKQSLHIFGGNKRRVELTVPAFTVPLAFLAFQAERWTSRKPFHFRVEHFSDGKWVEIFNGDRAVVVGRSFKSHVEIPLKTNPARLRFTCTSPDRSGILIDDVALIPAVPQKIASVIVDDVQVPVLIGLETNPLLRIRVETTGTLKSIALTGAAAMLSGSIAEKHLAAVQWLASGSSANFGDAKPFGESSVVKKGSLVFNGKQTLRSGANYFWLSVKLSERADIDRIVKTSCTFLKFSDGYTHKPQSAAGAAHRLGVAVRQGGQGGVHTCRIPGLATTLKGTLIGVYDLRNRSGGDLPGDIDVGMSRSTDGGRTWERSRAIMDMGRDARWRYDGIGDPAVLVDRNTGTIWVAATWSHGNRSWVGSGPGLKPEETGQLMLVRSDDDGLTWSRPINITAQVKRPEWCFLLQGPGKGITMTDGTLVFAAQFQDTPANKRLPRSSILFSRDHGKTWHVGTGAFDDTTEAQVVELEPGVLMLNCRYNRENRRVVMVTRDMGRTWAKHPTHREALIEPRACMASLISINGERTGKPGSHLLFSNPNSLAGRNHITIKASNDRGLTWPEESQLLLDEWGSAGYSCLSMIDDKTVGILYEGSRAHMTFQRVKLADIATATPVKHSSNKPAAFTRQYRGKAIGYSIRTERRRYTEWVENGRAIVRELYDYAIDPNENTNLATQQMYAEFVQRLSRRLRKGVNMPPRFARAFGSHMVLQQGQPIPAWGTAKPEAKVTVTLGTQKQIATADADGRWETTFSALKAKGLSLRLTAETPEGKTTLDDILVGEVWLCAGQSNMEWKLSQSATAKTAVPAAKHARLRLFNFVGAARGSSGDYTPELVERLTPERFSSGQWRECSPESAAPFSAVGFFFGQKLLADLDVPVGLINVAMGGTPAEAWVRRRALAAHPQLKLMVQGNWLQNKSLEPWCRGRGASNLKRALSAGDYIPSDDLGPNHSFKPAFMWDAALAPLRSLPLAGALWYQGESNAESEWRVAQHDAVLSTLITDWRAQWKRPDLPFIFVQLPAMKRPHWPAFRASQQRVQDALPHTGMAVTIDLGHPTDVHPRDKQPVGERLERLALAFVYGESPCGGSPRFESAERRGDSVMLHLAKGRHELRTSDEAPAAGFEVRDRKGRWISAEARIHEADTVMVISPLGHAVEAVRYAWTPYPEPKVNLVDEDGLPASPFEAELSF